MRAILSPVCHGLRIRSTHPVRFETAGKLTTEAALSSKLAEPRGSIVFRRRNAVLALFAQTGVLTGAFALGTSWDESNSY